MATIAVEMATTDVATAATVFQQIYAAGVRDIEVIDSERRLLLAIRRMVREEEGRPPSTARIDGLLDERAEPPGQDLVAAQPVQCHHTAGCSDVSPNRVCT
jgi:hypothetical protein